MATFPNFDSFTIPIIRNLYDRSFYDLDSLISSINWNKKRISTMSASDLETYKNDITFLHSYMAKGDEILREYYAHKEYSNSLPNVKVKKQAMDNAIALRKKMWATPGVYDGQTYNDATSSVKTVLAPAIKAGMPRTAYYTYWVTEYAKAAEKEYNSLNEVKKLVTFENFVLYNIDGTYGTKNWSLDKNISTAEKNNITLDVTNAIVAEIDAQIEILNSKPKISIPIANLSKVLFNNKPITTIYYNNQEYEIKIS